MANNIYLSILIPTRNNASDLRDCINSISRLDFPLEKAEIIIWDNDSKQEYKDDVKNLIQKLGSSGLNIRLIEHNENYGVYTTRDALLRLVHHESRFILSLDDDVILPALMIKKLVAHFAHDQKVGIIGPRIIYDEWPPETAHGAGFINRWLGRYVTEDAQFAIECDYVIGCCMLIRKQVIDKIGSFDRDYYTSHGEVDFCLRAKTKGYKVLYDPGVVVRHRVDKGGTRSLERIYYVYRNKLLVIKKNWPVPQKYFALFIYSFLWFPKAIIDSIILNRKIKFPELKTIIRAMIDGWFNRFGKRI